MARRYYVTKESEAFRSFNSNTTVFLIHGLMGNKSRTYWGSLLNLLSEDIRMSNVDFVSWQYATSICPFPNSLSILNRRRVISTIEETAGMFSTYVESEITNNAGRRVIFFGHSLGGFISLIAAYNMLQTDIPIDAVGVNGTPLKLARLPKTFRWLLSSNPQTAFLSNEQSQIGTLTYTLKFLASKGVSTGYFQNCHDEILSNQTMNNVENIANLFDSYHYLACSHTWFADIQDRHSEPYRRVADWLVAQIDLCNKRAQLC